MKIRKMTKFFTVITLSAAMAMVPATAVMAETPVEETSEIPESGGSAEGNTDNEAANAATGNEAADAAAGNEAADAEDNEAADAADNKAADAATNNEAADTATYNEAIDNEETDAAAGNENTESATDNEDPEEGLAVQSEDEQAENVKKLESAKEEAIKAIEAKLDSAVGIIADLTNLESKEADSYKKEIEDIAKDLINTIEGYELAEGEDPTEKIEDIQDLSEDFAEDGTVDLIVTKATMADTVMKACNEVIEYIKASSKLSDAEKEQFIKEAENLYDSDKANIDEAETSGMAQKYFEAALENFETHSINAVKALEFVNTYLKAEIGALFMQK